MALSQRILALPEKIGAINMRMWSKRGEFLQALSVG